MCVIHVFHGLVWQPKEYPNLFQTPRGHFTICMWQSRHQKAKMAYHDLQMIENHEQILQNCLIVARYLCQNKMRLQNFLKRTFYVKREYVVACIEHLTNLQSTKQIRARTREEEHNQRKEKRYDEYDCLNLVLQGQLNKLRVQELNKFIIENKLNKKGNKQDKLNAITADVLRKSHNRTIEDLLEQQQDKDQESSDSDGESDQDLVLEEFGSESETEGDSESEQLRTVEPIPLVVKTRYGRFAGNWALSHLE